MKIALVIDGTLARPDAVQESLRTIGRAMGERGRVGAAGDNAAMESFSSLFQ